MGMTKGTPSYEKPLYEAFARTYATLLDLKNNRSRYISLNEVYSIYNQFLRDVHELSIVRKDEELKGITVALPTPVDSLIDDIWQLLLLLFVTCGLLKFAPATYSLLLTVYKLLTHVKECQVYLADDLEPIKARLDEIEQIINNLNAEDEAADAGGELDHRREETLLLRNKLAKCRQAYREIEHTFDQIPPDLEPVYGKLIRIRKALFKQLTDPDKRDGAAPDPLLLPASAVSAGSDATGTSTHILRLAEALRKVELQRDPLGKFHSTAPEQQVAVAQMVLDGLLDDCNNLLYDVNIQQDNDILSRFALLAVGSPTEPAARVLAQFKELYAELLAVKRTLDNLLVTRRWTMRETDLYAYQKTLKSIDERRGALTALVEQGAEDPGAHTKRAQLLVLYLLRRCYSLVYKLLESSEPVSESLQPIHNQLLTVRRCLLEIKRVDGLNSLRELFPFQFKLALLDNLRHDGKFIVNGQVPEGQGTLNALLAECFDIVYELKIELEEREERRDNITDEEDKGLDDEVELKRERYAEFNEADYDAVLTSELSSLSNSEFESNDYY